MRTLNLLPENFEEIIKNFCVLLLDADGVWFTGHETRMVLPTGDVSIMKTRHFCDGQGLSFLRAIGVRVAFVSGEGEPLGSIIQKLNELPSVKEGKWAPIDLFTKKIGKGDKVKTIECWLSENNLTWQNCVYIGDDVNDFEPMMRVALAIAPANATRRIRQIAHLITEKSGGNGAIREFAEYVLDLRGIDELTLPPA